VPAWLLRAGRGPLHSPEPSLISLPSITPSSGNRADQSLALIRLTCLSTVVRHVARLVMSRMHSVQPAWAGSRLAVVER